MTQDTPELTAPEVLPHAVNTLQEHLPLHVDGYKYTTADLFNLLVGVAATQGTLESGCADLVGTPDPQTIRGYFKEQLRVEEFPVLEQKITTLTGWRNHHIVQRSLGGSDQAANRVLLHPTCHRQVHSQRVTVEKPRPGHRALERLERSAVKVARCVLRGRECSNTLLLPGDIPD